MMPDIQPPDRTGRDTFNQLAREPKTIQTLGLFALHRQWLLQNGCKQGNEGRCGG